MLQQLIYVRPYDVETPPLPFLTTGAVRFPFPSEIFEIPSVTSIFVGGFRYYLHVTPKAISMFFLFWCSQLDDDDNGFDCETVPYLDESVTPPRLLTLTQKMLKFGHRWALYIPCTSLPESTTIAVPKSFYIDKLYGVYA